ncbi:ABC transporter ATP-binding protein [uncultured Streptococcus sp.]|uniref:ABC transporter ATP-binding protein n=1 Tax=uncultured Streptococcus sp. TaxID=83427 RepID=UPI00258E9C40|nr:ABC transporter ATP-binding protein [uncultured Streptococcus sp.]
MIEFKNISKIYQVGQQEVKALDNISFSINKGKFTVILGPSGSGKSTLLNILGGMDRSTHGQFLFDNKEINLLNDKQLSIYRKDVVGFVFQFYNLIPSLTALENISIAGHLRGNSSESEKLLDKVGLSHRKNNFPNQLSGGEMQRVSIARALAKKPRLLLCDEPTGALDSKNGHLIIKLLKETAKNNDVAVVMVTHNDEFQKYADTIINLKDGKIKSISNKNIQENLDWESGQ